MTRQIKAASLEAAEAIAVEMTANCHYVRMIDDKSAAGGDYIIFRFNDDGSSAYATTYINGEPEYVSVSGGESEPIAIIEIQREVPSYEAAKAEIKLEYTATGKERWYVYGTIRKERKVNGTLGRKTHKQIVTHGWERVSKADAAEILSKYGLTTEQFAEMQDAENTAALFASWAKNGLTAEYLLEIGSVDEASAKEYRAYLEQTSEPANAEKIVTVIAEVTGSDSAEMENVYAFIENYHGADIVDLEQHDEENTTVITFWGMATERASNEIRAYISKRNVALKYDVIEDDTPAESEPPGEVAELPSIPKADTGGLITVELTA